MFLAVTPMTLERIGVGLPAGPSGPMFAARGYTGPMSSSRDRSSRPPRRPSRMRSPWALVAVLAAGVVAAGCGSAGSNQVGPSQPVASASRAAQQIAVGTASYARLAPQPFSALLRSDATVINVHVPYEGEISGTDLFIPFDQIAGRTADLPAKDEPIVLYCMSGRMSATAAETLVGLGYTNVTELGGGMEAWRAAGLPIQVRPGG